MIDFISGLDSQGIIALVAVFVASFAAIFTGFAAIFAGVQTILFRNHHRLSVKPLLTTQLLDEKQDDYHWATIYIKNSGLGPAIIKNYFVSINGIPFNSLDYSNPFIIEREMLKEFHKLVDPLIASALESVGQKEKIIYTVPAIGEDFSIQAGEKLRFFQIGVPLLYGPYVPSFLNVINKFSIDNISYKDIYENIYEGKFSYPLSKK